MSFVTHCMGGLTARCLVQLLADIYYIYIYVYICKHIDVSCSAFYGGTSGTLSRAASLGYLLYIYICIYKYICMHIYVLWSALYRVVWSHRMPYLHRSFSANEPYN